MAETYTSFTNKGVDAFRAAVIASALGLYRTTGMKANRAYTPKAMMAAAAEITGKTFKARDYEGAEKTLREWVKVQKLLRVATGEIS